MSCSERNLRYALSYDNEVLDLYNLLIKSNNSRTWFNKKFRLDESGLPKRLESLYNLLYNRLFNFGESVNRILKKYRLKQLQFNEYCYFQILRNIYLIIKNKYKTNIFPKFTDINDAIVKVYLFFLVNDFNRYISRYNDMLMKKGNYQKQANKINHNSNILSPIYNTTYSSITSNSIIMIREDYEPYKLCIIFYEDFYNVYNSLLEFLYNSSYDFEIDSHIYMSIQKLKNRIDKLHYLLVETVTGRIERYKQKRLEFEQIIKNQRLKREANEARQDSRPNSAPSWTTGLNQRELHTIGQISNNERKERQQKHLNSVAKIKQEEENQQIISACSTPGIIMDRNECNQAYARQKERNLKKAKEEEQIKIKYAPIYPNSGPYQGP
jgi:hypothetical protein